MAGLDTGHHKRGRKANPSARGRLAGGAEAGKTSFKFFEILPIIIGVGFQNHIPDHFFPTDLN